MTHLQGKVAIVTGASSGIGAVTAAALAARGVRVVGAALDQAGLDTLVAQVRQSGGEALGRVADVTRAEDMQALAAFTRESFGRIDILVNNAGLMLFSRWTDLAVGDWERMIEVNIKGSLNAIAAVLPHMLEQRAGQILNMDSVAGHQVSPSAGV